ncbi:MAG: hypothetical protein AAB617_01705 [Patescibacteria group bacterium]
MKEPKIVWPTPEPIVVHDFLQTGVDLLKEKIGSLSQDPRNPLSRVCVANSCFSLEPVRGCPLRCSYCVAGNDCRNLCVQEESYHNNIHDFDSTTIIPRKPEVLFKGDVLAKAMAEHPGFIKDKSIVSIAVGSSEAFLEGVEQETWAAMRFLADNGYKNPYWLVIKYGISDKLLKTWKERLRYVLVHGSKVIISVTESNAPAWLEPYRGNRFKNLTEIKQLGVHITHHLRPIIRGINDSEESITKSLKKSSGLAECICVGGLRVDPGIVLLWKHINKLDPTLLPRFVDTEKGKMPQKDLPDGFAKKVGKIMAKTHYDVPLFTRSSQMLAHILEIPDFNLYRYRTENNSVILNVPSDIQESIEKSGGKSLIEMFRETLKEIGLDALTIIQDGKNFTIKEKINYQEHRLLIHAIGFKNILP